MISLFLTLAISATRSAPAQAAPAEILILRHAEKPPGDANDEGQDLGERGFERAHALATMFTTDSRFLTHGSPVAIYAGSPKHPTGSLRPLQTIEPTAAAFGLTVITRFGAKKMTAAAQEILGAKEYEGKTVIASWTRDEIPGLMLALGLPLDKIPKWRSKTFDRVWKIELDQDGKIVSFDDLAQNLLPGDSKN